MADPVIEMVLHAEGDPDCEHAWKLLDRKPVADVPFTNSDKTLLGWAPSGKIHAEQWACMKCRRVEHRRTEIE